MSTSHHIAAHHITCTCTSHHITSHAHQPVSCRAPYPARMTAYKRRYPSPVHIRRHATRISSWIPCHASHRIVSYRSASHRITSHRIASHRIASHRTCCMTTYRSSTVVHMRRDFLLEGHRSAPLHRHAYHMPRTMSVTCICHGHRACVCMCVCGMVYSWRMLLLLVHRTRVRVACVTRIVCSSDDTMNCTHTKHTHKHTHVQHTRTHQR